VIVGIMGAGAIGCYVGGCLAATGVRVVFVGRERLHTELAASGLTLTDLGPAERTVSKERIEFSTDAAALGACNVVLCCVKSAQTAEAGHTLTRVLAKDALVVSMQNGVGNAAVLRQEMPGFAVLGGIVGFNVVPKGGGVFRKATSGPLVIENADPRAARLVHALRHAALETKLVANIRPQQWSKLIMNLNNAVSALSDRPTKQLLLDPGYRRILAAVMAEALGVLRVAKQRTARLGPLPIGCVPFILGLPAPLLNVVASLQVKIDPEARSSMWEDLSQRRLTEVDWLNGEIVRLAASCNEKAPLNARMVDLVHAAEAANAGSPKLSADAFWAALTA
jgi:2-dehydropantoate 2-reductase